MSRPFKPTHVYGCYDDFKPQPYYTGATVDLADRRSSHKNALLGNRKDSQTGFEVDGVPVKAETMSMRSFCLCDDPNNALLIEKALQMWFDTQQGRHVKDKIEWAKRYLRNHEPEALAETGANNIGEL